METDTATDISLTKSAIDAAILDAITSAGLMSCDVTSRKLEEFVTMKRLIHSEARHLNSQFMLRNMEIDSNISNTCTPSQDGVCNVVLNTLSVSTDHPTITKSNVRKQTISIVQSSMSTMSMAGATLSYQPMNSLTSSPQESESDVSSEDEDAASEDSPQLSVSAKSTDQVNNDESTKIEKKSISSAATGAMAAGALAAVFAGLFLVKKKRMSTTEIDYVDQGILGARDIEKDGNAGFGELPTVDETALVDVDLSQDDVVII
eukprot:15365375-Ditylum_brightwellii.AAC.1